MWAQAHFKAWWVAIVIAILLICVAITTLPTDSSLGLKLSVWHPSIAANRSQEASAVSDKEQNLQGFAALQYDGELANIRPGCLQTEYNSQTQALKVPGDVEHVKFHWVINSCDRIHWSRTVASTLLSGLLNGLQPESISIAWCRPYEGARVPSLMFNLRHSAQFKIFYLPKELPVTAPSTLLLGLLIPGMLGAPDLPLLITEDDVVFAPDAGKKLSVLISQARDKAHPAPFFLNLYNPPKEVVATVAEAQRLWNSGDGGRPLAFPRHQQSSAGSLKQTKMSYWYGNQGLLLEPNMTKYMARHIYKVLTKKLAPDKAKDFIVGMPDRVLKDFLANYGCAFKHDPKANCQVFNVEPSLVQHIGTASSLFMPVGNVTSNPRFHLAVDFPVPVKFPGEDAPAWW